MTGNGVLTRWVGSPSFLKATAALRFVRDDLLTQVESRPGLRNRDGMRAHIRMCSRVMDTVDDPGFRVVCFDPAQVNALPEWDEAADAHEYAEEMELPAESLYLDFTDDGGNCAVLPETEWSLGGWLRAAWVSYDPYLGLQVAPLIWPPDWVLDEDAHDVHEPLYWTPTGVLNMGAPHEVDARRLAREHGMDTVPSVVGAVVDDVPVTLALTHRMFGDARLRAEVLSPLLSVSLLDSVRKDDEAPGTSSEMVQTWTATVYHATLRVIAALSILDAEEIELVPAGHKRDRKRAEKRQAQGKPWKIADAVQWRRRRKRYETVSEPTGEKRHFKYRFWVRGHVRHYPLGAEYAREWVTEENASKCPRLQNNCGMCRRVRVAPFIKGPEDAPVMLKTLIVKDPPEVKADLAGRGA